MWIYINTYTITHSVTTTTSSLPFHHHINTNSNNGNTTTFLLHTTLPTLLFPHAFQKSHFSPKHPFWRVKRGWFYLYEIWSLEFSKVIYSFFSVLNSFSGFLWLLLLSSNYWYIYILNHYYNNQKYLTSSLSLVIV